MTNSRTSRVSDVIHPFACRAASRDAAQAEVEAMFRLDGEDAGELLLVRHAEPARGANSDPLLSCAGLVQAERLAEGLRSVWIEAVYVAPERRAVQTAKVISTAIDRPQFEIEGLAEIEFDASAIDETDEMAPNVGERFTTEPRWDSLPGFSSSRAFRRRAIQAVEGAIACNPARRVVVVTHSSVINAYLSMILAIPRDVFFAPEHASISVVRWSEDRYGLRTLNDVAHLSSAGLLDGATGPERRAFTRR
jgi:2,3-bisphosphoglycerate-dependent phosphoglycerate mutase